MERAISSAHEGVRQITPAGRRVQHCRNLCTPPKTMPLSALPASARHGIASWLSPFDPRHHQIALCRTFRQWSLVVPSESLDALAVLCYDGVSCALYAPWLTQAAKTCAWPRHVRKRETGLDDGEGDGTLAKPMQRWSRALTCCGRAKLHFPPGERFKGPSLCIFCTHGRQTCDVTA